MHEQPGTPLLDSITHDLQPKHLLVVLDNFEQLVAAAPLVADLLATAPQVKVLVTSRVPLHVQGEHEYAVPPLALPHAAHALSRDGVRDADAVRLFVARAQAVTAEFALTDANAATIAQICMQLDGLPLAIELAAARMKVFTPTALLARLKHRLALLTGGARDLPPRQRTLRTAIDWSYNLLSAEEQTLFRRLGVFVGGWTITAAEAVCDPARVLTLDVVDGLATLLDHSLLTQTVGPDDEPRFGMLEMIREYALEQLERSGEAETIRRAHADYFLTLAEAAEPELRGAAQQVWLDHLEAEHANLRAALQGALDQGDGERVLRLCTAIWRFWERRGYMSEGRTWLQAALAISTNAPAALRAKALDAASWLAFFRNDYTSATALQEESLALRRTLGDKQGIADSLRGLGAIVGDQGNRERGDHLTEESLALYRELGDQHGIMRALNNLSLEATKAGEYARAVALIEEALPISRALGDLTHQAWLLIELAAPLYFQGDFVRAAALAEESLALWRRLGDQEKIALLLGWLGRALHAQGDIERAMALYEESLAVAQQAEDKLGVASAHLDLGYVAYEHGDYGHAAQRYEQALALFRQFESLGGSAAALRLLGEVAQEREDFERAWALYRDSLALYQEQHGGPFEVNAVLVAIAMLWGAQGFAVRAVRLFGAAQRVLDTLCASLGVEQPRYDRYLAAVRAQLDEATFAQAWAEGQAMTLEQAVAYAQQGE